MAISNLQSGYLPTSLWSNCSIYLPPSASKFTICLSPALLQHMPSVSAPNFPVSKHHKGSVTLGCGNRGFRLQLWATLLHLHILLAWFLGLSPWRRWLSLTLDLDFSVWEQSDGVYAAYKWLSLEISTAEKEESRFYFLNVSWKHPLLITFPKRKKNTFGYGQTPIFCISWWKGMIRVIAAVSWK